MEQIRVLVGVTGLLGGIVRDALLDDPSIALCDYPLGRSLRDIVAETRPHVLILGVGERKLTEEQRETLFDQPRLKILTIIDDRCEGYLHELRPAEIRIGELSPKLLLDAVCTSAASASKP